MNGGGEGGLNPADLMKLKQFADQLIQKLDKWTALSALVTIDVSSNGYGYFQRLPASIASYGY